MPPLLRRRHKLRGWVRHFTIARHCVDTVSPLELCDRSFSLRSALAQMEVEGIPQAYTINGCSYVRASEKAQVKKPPSEYSTPDVAAGEPGMVACFDCSICLDVAVNPVVTLCGHLYCWPCIYKWMQLEHEGISNDKCPVCKAHLSKDTLIPLYGRGGNGTDWNSKVPRRPTHYLRHYHVPVSSVDDRSSSRMNGTRHNDSYQPMQQLLSESFVLGGLAKLILPWGCRNNAGNMIEETYTRRQLILMGSSLHQIWLFLFFGAICCLLLF